MHSQQDAAFNDSYIAAHRLDRRKAVIDRFYLTSVTNRAFNEYFGNVTYGCLTEFVNPGEKESFIEFIDGFDLRMAMVSTGLTLLSLLLLKVILYCVILILRCWI